MVKFKLIFLISLFSTQTSLSQSKEPYRLDAAENIIDLERYLDHSQTHDFSCASACLIVTMLELCPSCMSDKQKRNLDNTEISIHKKVNMSNYPGYIDFGTFPKDVVRFIKGIGLHKIKGTQYFNYTQEQAHLIIAKLEGELQKLGKVLYQQTSGLKRIEKEKLFQQLDQGTHFMIPFLYEEGAHYFLIRKKIGEDKVIFMDSTFGSNHEMPYSVLKEIIYENRAFNTRGCLHKFFGTIIKIKKKLSARL